MIPPSGQMPNAGGGGGRGGRGVGPVVLPGRYTVAVGSLKQEVTVEPDPHFPISESDRKKRHAAIHERLLASSSSWFRRATRRAALTEQMAGLRQYFTALGDSGKASLAAIDKVTPEIAKVQTQINRAIASAAQVENAMDGYDGLPTAVQLRQLDWAWEDAAAVRERAE